MIDDLIKVVAERVGLGDDKARAGTGILFALLQKFGDTAVIGEFLDKIGGAGALAEEHGSALEGGAKGGIGGLIGGLIGGKGEDLLAALDALKSAGLSADEAKQLPPAVVDAARDQVGPELMDKVLSAAPILKRFL